LLIGETIEKKKKVVVKKEKRENSIIDSPMKHESSFVSKALNNSHTHDLNTLNTIMEIC